MPEEKTRKSVVLTDNRVEKLRPREADFRVFDTKVPGFHVLVTMAGVKTFRIQFQRAAKKTSATIGRVGTWDVDSARAKAAELRRLFDEGRDVKAFLEEERAGKTVSDVVTLWRDDYSGKLKPLTKRGYESVLKVVVAQLGDRLIKDLDYPSIHRFYLAVAKRAPIRANRCIDMLSKLCRIAEKEGLRPMGSNPCRQIEQGTETPRKRALSAAELRAVEETLARLVDVGFLEAPDRKPKKKGKIAPKKMDPMVADLVRLIAFTGLRRGEALSLKWADIDEAANVMRFESHKGDRHGAKELPLNGPARAVLAARAAVKLSPFVFPGAPGEPNEDPKPFQGEGKWVGRVIKESDLPGWTLHDLRRTFNSVCAGLGFPPQAFDLLLGHRLGGVRDTYTVMGAGVGLLAQASEDTAQWIAAAMRGENPKSGEKVSAEQAKRKA